MIRIFNNLKLESYSLYIIGFVIFSPIFISLDFSQGIKFDAVIGRQYNMPSIPISFILLSIFSIFHLKSLLMNNKLMILTFIIIVYTALNIYYGINRAVIVGLGMLLPLVSFYIFKEVFKNKINILQTLFFSLFSVIMIKLMNSIIVYISKIVYYITTRPEVDLTLIPFSSRYFIYPYLGIYNYYDYFPYVFFLAIVLSLYNIFNRVFLKSSIILIIMSMIEIQYTNSRLFIYGIYIIPLLYIYFKITKFKLITHFILFTSGSLIITLILGGYYFPISDPSLIVRNYHAYHYFQDFSFINLFLPFLNAHRIQADGSLHNELLEIFSFFGFTLIYYLYLIRDMFINVKKKYEIISYMIMFILLSGTLIQINISNPYVGIITGMILAVIYENKKQKDITKTN